MLAGENGWPSGICDPQDGVALASLSYSRLCAEFEGTTSFLVEVPHETPAGIVVGGALLMSNMYIAIALPLRSRPPPTAFPGE